MFIIRTEQLDAMQETIDVALLADICDHLSQRHAASIEGYSDDLLDELIWEGMKRARRFGIRRGKHIRVFVTIMFLTAPNFWELEKARNILTEEGTPEDRKMERLANEMTDDGWEQARDLHNDEKWYV